MSGTIEGVSQTSGGLTDAEKLARIKEAIICLVTNNPCLAAIVELIGGDGDAGDVGREISNNNSGDEWFADFLRNLDESGMVRECAREVLPSLMKTELGAKEVDIKW